MVGVQGLENADRTRDAVWWELVGFPHPHVPTIVGCELKQPQGEWGAQGLDRWMDKQFSAMGGLSLAISFKVRSLPLFL